MLLLPHPLMLCADVAGPFCHRVLLTLEVSLGANLTHAGFMQSTSLDHVQLLSCLQEKGIKHDTHYIDLTNKPAWCDPWGLLLLSASIPIE